MKTEMQNMSPLEQMNQLLSDKKALIAAEMEKVNSAKQELLDFQQELSVKVREIQIAQEEIKKEKEALANEWKKLDEAKKNLQTSMEEVLEEKVKQEAKSLEELKKNLEETDKTDALNSSMPEFNLNQLRQSIGIDVVNTETTNTVVETNVEAPKVVIPELFQVLEKEITKSYSKWTKLELLPERYCLQFGEREIRFFDVSDDNKLPYVQIIVFTRNSKSDNKLLSTLTNAARVAPEWSINTEDNKIVCTMPFTSETKASAVLKKCNEFIKNYLS